MTPYSATRRYKTGILTTCRYKAGRNSPLNRKDLFLKGLPQEKSPVPERSKMNFARRHLPIFTFLCFICFNRKHTVPNKKIVTVAEQGTNITDKFFCFNTTTLSSL
jgi:hypothetical protein